MGGGGGGGGEGGLDDEEGGDTRVRDQAVMNTMMN